MSSVIEPGKDVLVRDHPERRSFYSRISEDGWALWIGGLLIATVLLVAFLSTDFKFVSPVYQWTDANELVTKILTGKNFSVIGYIGFVFAVLSSIAIWLSGGNPIKYMAGFIVIYLVAVLSLIIAGNKTITNYGIEYVVFGLIIGLVISNLNLSPVWLKEAVRSEFFIKSGLIILGTSILFTDIVNAGLPGILQA